ncbi:MAG: pitrilysin family protein [Planctomycetota bacterium]
MNHARVFELSCGASLVVEPMSGVRSASAQWLVPAGNAHDPADELGRAELFSEILLRGAGSRDARTQTDAFDRIGASRSASAGRFNVSVGVTSLGERMHEALSLVADMIFAPRFDADAVEASKELAVQAIASLQDDPQQRAVIAARQRHFPAPLDRSGYGVEEHIVRATPEGLADGWRRAASPKGAIIAVAGAVDADAVHARIESLTSGWTGDSAAVALGSDASRGYGHETDASNQVQIIVVHDAPPERHADAVLERLHASVLSGGMSARLFREVREKRALCYAVNASYAADRDFGSVTAYVGTTPERAQEALDVLVEQLAHARTKAGAATQNEFARAVTGMKSRLVFSGESTQGRAAALAADVFRLGRPRSLAERAEEIDSVTLGALHAYSAREDLGRLTIQTLGPDPLVEPSKDAGSPAHG